MCYSCPLMDFLGITFKIAIIWTPFFLINIELHETFWYENVLFGTYDLAHLNAFSHTKTEKENWEKLELENVVVFKS